MTDAEPPESRQYVFLDVVLAPTRSLPRRGFAVLMAGLAAASLICGTTCILVGAWPVFGFFGLDVALVYLAFRLSYRSARGHECVRLTERSLTVERVSVRGERRRWQFEPSWLRRDFYGTERHQHPDARLAWPGGGGRELARPQRAAQLRRGAARGARPLARLCLGKLRLAQRSGGPRSALSASS